MLSHIGRVSATMLIGLHLVGCNRSNPQAATQPAPVSVGKEQPALSEPKVVDPDRRAADWVLSVDGSIRVVINGAPREFKKGEKLPDGPVKLLAIDLRNCPKATDEGREHLRGLRGLQELTINNTANIRNLDFLADMTGLQMLNSEGQAVLIMDKDVDQIKGMTNLKTLIIVSQVETNPQLTDKVLAVVKELKHLEQLRLCNCSITDEGVRQLGGHVTLRLIDFWLTKVGDTGLASLASLPKLEQVGVQQTQVTDAGVKAFLAKSPKVRVIK